MIKKWKARKRFLLSILACMISCPMMTIVEPNQAVASPSNDEIIINEIYGGGGRANAVYRYNFIELYNPTENAVDLGSYRLSTFRIDDGTPTEVYTFESNARINPRDYYLVKLESLGTNGADFDADATGTLGNNNMSGVGNNNGQIVLVNDEAVVDAVAYGGVTATGAQYRGEGDPAIGATNQKSIERVDFQDTDDNNSDFLRTDPSPTQSGNPAASVAYANGMIVIPAPIAAEHTDPGWFLGADGAANRQALIDFCTDRHIDSIYINFFNYLYNGGSANKIYDSDIRSFISQFHQAGISVFNLSGNANWMTNNFWEVGLDLVNTFNAGSLSPEERFDGYVYNLDPVGAGIPSGWNWPDDPNAVNFSNLILNISDYKGDKVAAESWHIDSLGLAMQGNSASMISAAQFALDHEATDFLLLYTQSDTAQGMIDEAKDVVDYAEGVDKNVIVTAWASEMANRPTKTLFGKNLAYVYQAFGAIDDYFSLDPGYNGIAVYHYKSYSAIVDDASPYVYPTSFTYDKSNASDIHLSAVLNGSVLVSIRDQEAYFLSGSDYTDNDGEIIIHHSYLSNLEDGQVMNLTLTFSDDSSKTISVHIIDSHKPAEILTDTVYFDRKLPNNAGDFLNMASAGGSIVSPDFKDAWIELALNGKELASVKYNGVALLHPSQYAMSGTNAIIKKEFLMTLPIGDTELTFHFNDDSSQSLTVNVTDTTLSGLTGSYAGVAISQESRALFVWEGNRYLDQRDSNAGLNREQLAAFTFNKGINEIYYGTAAELREIAVGGDPEDLKSFIRQMHEAGIKVHALAGENVWIDDSEGAVQFLNNLYAYNRDVDPIYRFDGVQYDVEPWTIKNPNNDARWTEDPYNMDDYKGMVDAVWAAQQDFALAGEHIPLGYSIAAWLDNHDPTTNLPRISSGLNYYVQDRSDYIVVMDYQDMAFAPAALNPTGIVPWLTNEISYANAMGKKVVAAVTTNPESAGTLPANTFNGDSMTKMNAQLNIVESVFARNKSFAGTAVQSYRWYSNDYFANESHDFYGITLNSYYSKLSVGQTKQLSESALLKTSDDPDASVTWSVYSGNGVVSVDNHGLVVAESEGIAVIRATSNTNHEYYADSIFYVSDDGDATLAEVSGKVKLPEGHTAVGDDLIVKVIAYNDSDYYVSYVKVLEGDNESSFTINNVNPGEDYTFYYAILPDQGYLTAGYNDGWNTVADRSQAEEYDILSSGISDIHLTLLASDTPSVVTVQVDRAQLWPPNRKLVPIHVTVAVDDAGSGIASIHLKSIAIADAGGADPTSDIKYADFGTPDYDFSLRAERSGAGSGRVYTITYVVTDQTARITEATAAVTVPHDASDE